MQNFYQILRYLILVKEPIKNHMLNVYKIEWNILK